MKEILGNDLTEFFNKVAIFEKNVLKNLDFTAVYKNVYKNKTYEVWIIDDDTYKYISDMSEKEFENLCGEDGWWRWSSGSILYSEPIEEFIINGKSIKAWCCKEHDEFFHNDYSSLTEYMCEHVGASQPKNVCALAVDLAKINGMSMGKLFTEYEG